jgi:hypothetical protein
MIGLTNWIQTKNSKWQGCCHTIIRFFEVLDDFCGLPFKGNQNLIKQTNPLLNSK